MLGYTLYFATPEEAEKAARDSLELTPAWRWRVVERGHMGYAVSLFDAAGNHKGYL